MDGNDLILLGLEFASWFAFGLSVLLAIAALVVRLVIGRWVPARGYVIADDDRDRAVIHWFRESGTRTGEAVLTPEQLTWLDGRTEADFFYRAKRPATVRFTHHHSAARILTIVALGFLSLGIATSAAQLVVLAVTG